MDKTSTAKSWYLYVIENRLGHLYTGITTDVARRFNEHAKGGRLCAKSLKGKGPLTLKHCVRLDSHGDALRIERYIKRKIRSLVLGADEFESFKPKITNQPHVLIWQSEDE